MLNLTLGSHKSPKLLYLSQHHLPFIWQSALHLPPAKMKIQLAVECLLLLVLFIVPSQEAEQYQTLLSMRKARGSNQGNNTEWLSEYTSIALRRKSDYRRVMSSQDGSQEADRITALPGQPSGAKFSQYGGYVTVDSSKGKALYYYLTEATDDPASKPLVLWLNGGPGCSSVGYGAFNELGPFRVNEDVKTLSSNPYAWNKVANILFLESPVGVGFSYSNTSAGYDQIGDKRTAEDAFTFLINWLERFPQYKNRDFYMTGESYAGNYVPELAHVILTHTQDFPQKPPISLKGIMMGNAVINVPTDNLGYYTYMWSHALIPDEIFDGIISNCNLSSNFITTTCADFENQATKLIGNIDPYSIYAPVCSAYKDQGPGVSSAYYDPCSLQYTKMYLNRPDVQKALHANIIGLPFAWDACSNFLFNNWNDTPSTMFPIYRELFNAAIPFMLYSGDVDSIVPVTSTRLSINELKLPIKTPWYPWKDGDEVGGYSVVYEGLTFATIRGAGHQVPSYEPARVLTAFTRFLAGKPL